MKINLLLLFSLLFLRDSGPGTSLQITVDPRHPASMPHCCFLGADQGQKIIIRFFKISDMKKKILKIFAMKMFVLYGPLCV
jgi:hypothetical protein